MRACMSAVGYCRSTRLETRRNQRLSHVTAAYSRCEGRYPRGRREAVLVLWSRYCDDVLTPGDDTQRWVDATFHSRIRPTGRANYLHASRLRRRPHHASHRSIRRTRRRGPTPIGADAPAPEPVGPTRRSTPRPGQGPPRALLIVLLFGRVAQPTRTANCRHTSMRLCRRSPPDDADVSNVNHTVPDGPGSGTTSRLTAGRSLCAARASSTRPSR